MRVLILNWKDRLHPAAGGAETYTHEIAQRWAAQGVQVTLFAAAVAGRPARERLDGVDVVRHGGRLGVYAAARRFYTGHGRGRYDVVVDEVNTRPFLAPRWVRDAPVVALIHQVAREVWFHETPWPAALAGRFVLEPWWLRTYRDVATLTVSASSARSLAGYGLRDVRVVPEGVDRPARPPQPGKARQPTVCFVGRMTSSKRPGDALTAFEHVRGRLPGAQLWMVGDGPLRPALADRHVPGVRWFGRVDETQKAELMARAHALVLTSVREGWGLVVDEAAAVGTPTIAYDRPGLCDSVPAAGGTLVPPRPQALGAELARQLPRLAAQPPGAGWRGGAVGWDEVAEEVLDHVRGAAA